MITFALRPRENRVKGDLAAFRQYLGKLTGDLLTQEACLTARAALKYSPPMVAGGGKGDTAAAGKMGERAIDKDIKAIFAAPHRTLSGVFYQKAGSRARFARWRSLTNIKLKSNWMQDIFTDPDEDRAYSRAMMKLGLEPPRNKIADSMGQASSYHKRNRIKGRVTKFNGPDEQTKRYPVVIKEQTLKKYIALRQKVVGKLKSGWYDIINTYGRNLNIFGRTVDAGAKGLPKYVTRLRFKNGRMTKNMTGHSKRLLIANLYGDAEGAADERGTFGAVVKHRLAALAKRPYQVYADRLVRNWNKNLTPKS